MAATQFKLLQPATLDEALSLLAAHKPAVRALAGGTDLVPKLKAGVLKVETLVSLRKVPGLAGVSFDSAKGLVIGGGATLTEVAETPGVAETYPGLAYACSVMATTQIRNMGTVAGNVANSAPSADTAAPLLAYDASLSVVGPQGRRSVALADFFTGPGMNVLAGDEIILSIELPMPAAAFGSAYHRLSARSEVDIAAVGVAGFIGLGADGRVDRCRLALAAVAPTPLRCLEAEAAVIGQKPDEAILAKAAEAAQAAARPIDDVRATAAYRRAMVKVLAHRVLKESLTLAQGGAA